MTETQTLDALLDRAAKAYAAGQTALAAKLLREAIAIAPENPTVRLRYAMAIWHGEDRAKEALKILAELGRKYPQASIFATEATVLASLGQFDASAKAARKALAADPHHSSAWLDLATATDRDGGVAVLRLLEAALPKAKSDKERQDIHHAAARLLRKRGARAQAWDHTEQANSMHRPKWTAQQEHAFRDELRAVFTPDLMERLAGQGDPDPRMIFVFGMPRSGTTLLERMLLAHPSIASVGETPVAGTLYTQLRKQAGSIDATRRWMTPPVLAQISQALHQGMVPRLQSTDAGRIIDKMPGNLLFAPFLRLVLPKAMLISMRRHPADVGLSCYEASFAFGLDYATRLDLLGQAIRMEADLLADWRALPGIGIHEVRYEDLIRDPESVLRGILERAGLEWDPACLAPAQTGTIKTASIAQARGPVNNRSVGRWHAMADQLAPMLRAMGGADWAEAEAARPAHT